MTSAARATSFAWGIFCASSWTWCIGMFLPIIMLQRYGWTGFLVFAIPNVLGCAAFGYVLRRGERSRALCDRHEGAMRLFSIVTIAYHVFFLGLAGLLLTAGADEPPRVTAGLLIPLIAVMIAGALARLGDRGFLTLAGLVYAGSIGLFVHLGTEPLSAFDWSGERPGDELLWLAPTIAFGFLLCPYLDLTFHRALQRSPSRHAFGVFGFAFTVMIVLTAAYAGILQTGAGVLVMGHLLGQSIFTLAAHLREVQASLAASARVSGPAWWTAPVAAGAIGLILALAAVAAGEPTGASIDVYLRFLVFYGLVFPLYVLIVMTGGRRVTGRPGWLLWLAGAMLVAAPFYELGFIHHHTWLLPIPLMGFLLWRGLLSRQREPARSRAAARAV